MTISSFKKNVWEFYLKHGRSLPWRNTQNPYRILVSEIMLQQTQVLRVVPKYRTFLKQFPTVHSLAAASLRDVLVMWQGLGYNRRAKMLHECAKCIVKECGGKVPTDEMVLRKLPGIGPYTAGAIMAFAYNQPRVFIETNIRSVFIHSFFKGTENVRDTNIFPLIEKTLDRKNPREWYFALMDYGSMLKQEGANPSRKSAQHTKQTTFKGSDREIRGAIMKVLTSQKNISLPRLVNKLTLHDRPRVYAQLTSLVREGFVVQKGKSVRIA